MENPVEQTAATEPKHNALTFASMSDVLLAEIVCSEVSEAILGAGAGFSWNQDQKCWESPAQEIRFLGLEAKTGHVNLDFAYITTPKGAARLIQCAIPVMDLRNRGARAIAIDIAQYVRNDIHLTLAAQK